MATPAGAVLTGGAGRRMGRPKAWIPLDGATMAERVADTLAESGCAPVVLVGLPPGGHPPQLRHRLVGDALAGEGPLVGLMTALRAASADGAAGVVVAACDLPWLDVGSVGRVLERAAAADVRSVVVVRAGHAVPLGWWAAAALPDVEALVAGGSRAWRAVLTLPGVVTVAIEGRATADVDVPGDLDR